MAEKPSNGPIWFIAGAIAASMVWASARPAGYSAPPQVGSTAAYNSMAGVAREDAALDNLALPAAPPQRSANLGINTRTLADESRQEVAAVERDDTLADYDGDDDQEGEADTVTPVQLPHPGQPLSRSRTGMAGNTTPSQAVADADTVTAYPGTSTYRPTSPTYSYSPPVRSYSAPYSGYGAVSPTTGAPRTVYVRGYTRSNGTYVQPYYRSRPRR